MKPDRVPVGPLQQAFLDSGVSATELAERLGWVSGDKADATKLRRILGLVPQARRPGGALTNRNMQYDTAVLIVRALHVDPREVDL